MFFSLRASISIRELPTLPPQLRHRHVHRTTTARPSPSSRRPDSNIFGRRVNEDDDSDPSTSLSYDPVGSPSVGDEFVLVSLEEATAEVDKAVNQTIDRLFSQNANATTPAELLRLFRYPAHSERGLARAAEIFQRTLELVAAKVRDAGFDIQGGGDEEKKMGGGNEEEEEEEMGEKRFRYEDLVSPSNLELIANLSGCEAHRAAREVNCTQDLCFHLKYRQVKLLLYARKKLFLGLGLF